MKWIADPRAFNVLIMALYLANACRWAIERRWPDVCYWLCALGITASVTWGYKH